MADIRKDIADRLADEISADVGNMQEEELSLISKGFDDILSDALKAFNSSTFDNEGFIKRFGEMDVGGNKQDKDMIKNVLNNLKHEYVDVQALNHSELLMRRDLFNICTQMPELRDVVMTVRDAIVECNISTGEVSRTITFENHDDNAKYESQAKDIETKYNLLMDIKNSMVPQTLMVGEFYINVVPYAKIFAELEAVRELKGDQGTGHGPGMLRGFGENKNWTQFRESVPDDVWASFKGSVNLYTTANLEYLKESITQETKTDARDTYRAEKNISGAIPAKNGSHDDAYLKLLLENIEVSNGSSVMMHEMGYEGFRDIMMEEYSKNGGVSSGTDKGFFETMRRDGRAILGKIPDEDINYPKWEHIKGAYVKYLDGLRIVPIRMDRRIIGYYYISTSMDLQINPAQPNGIVDLSFQHYTRDKNLVDKLASVIIKTFDKPMLERNIKLKSEIAEIIMAHRFSEGRLSFIFIPENEIVRIVVNQDSENKGHSILEPTLFPARMYLMLNLYNMIFSLNNTTTRIHYLKSSGLNKNYAAQIQRLIRKFQSRRITIDDIYSYSGVLNKVGGMGEMVLPAGRGDYKALETDTIEAVNKPIDVEFLEQQRRQAISGTGVPNLLVINALDEVDFAKTLELANTRYLSTVSSYKIDFNIGVTQFYKLLLKYCTDLEDDVINSFHFQFNPVKQQELAINSAMIGDFNTNAEFIASLYFDEDELKGEKKKPSFLMKNLRRELAKDMLPQLDHDNLEKIIRQVKEMSGDDELQKKASDAVIEGDDLKQVKKDKDEDDEE